MSPGLLPLRLLGSVLALAAVTVACGRDEPTRVPTVPKATREHASIDAPPPAAYLVADPNGRDGSLRIPLGTTGQVGVVVDGLRALASGGTVQVAPETTPEAILAAAPIPARLGGGFLFHTDHVVYRADTFTGPLQPLARTPDVIQAFSFAPKALLVRCRNGERWGLALPTGDRVAVTPVGVADVEGLDDGRALAFDDQGVAYTSSDFGAHWTDAGASLRAPPTRVANVRGELWILEQSGGAQRLEPDGRLVAFDAAPEEDEKPVRKIDPRWRGHDTPLRTAFTLGAALDERTAIVAADGDLVRVDLRSGELASITPGKLPPAGACRAVPTSNDVLFACVAPAQGHGVGAVTAFLASRGLSDAPVLEQSFAGEGRFAASDDGGVVFDAPCGAAPAPSASPALPGASGVLSGETQACVRQPDGTWRDVEVPSSILAPGQSSTVVRWVPRADGAAVAVLEGSPSGIYDPRSGQLEPVLGGLEAGGEYYRPRRFRLLGGSAAPDVVDMGWTLLPSGAVRGYLPRGGSIEILPGGRTSRSPYVLEVSHAGAFALGRSEDGRLFQTTDHGASWTEVAAPPTGLGRAVFGCTSAGCDLGAFYRVGWPVRAPVREASRGKAKVAGDVRRVRAPQLACRPSGPASSKVLPRTASSPDDLGLGTSRLPVVENNGDVMVRMAVGRTIVHPVHDPAWADAESPAFRALLSGYRTTREGDALQSAGPVKAVGQLRRTVSWVPGFDPSATVRRGAVLMADVIAAGRTAGMTTDEVLSDDMTENGSFVLVTPRDASQPSDVLFNNSRGMLALLRGGQDRARVAVRPTQNDAVVVSAVALANDELALLEVEAGGPGRVFKLAGSGPSDLFEVGTNLGEALFYPANPDAVAVGPRGEVGVLRTGSGTEPASELDPALLLLPGAKPKVLAPWSTLRPAEDPACKADAAAFRTTLQVVGPWIRSATPELRIEEGAPMVARVRWSEARVCLEALEAKVSAVSLRAPSGTAESPSEPIRQASWIVGRGGQWARVAVGEGLEWRQPLECALAP